MWHFEFPKLTDKKQKAIPRTAPRSWLKTVGRKTLGWKTPGDRWAHAGRKRPGGRKTPVGK